MSSPLRSLTTRRQSPLPNFRSSQRWTTDNGNVVLVPQMVKEYLAQYPAVLEEYVMESVSEDHLEDLLAKKRSSFPKNVTAGKPSTYFAEIGISELSKRLSSCQRDQEIFKHIFELTEAFAKVLNSERFTLYTVGGKDSDLFIFNPRNAKEPTKRVGPIGRQMTVSAHIAFEKKGENVYDLPQDPRFPKGVGFHDIGAHYVMCLPIISSANTPLAVAEFTRGWERDKFSSQDFEVANLLYSWVTACTQKIRINRILEAHEKLNGFLLETTKEMFQNMENIDALVKNIMIFTKNLVHADRCALFLVDKDRKELFADYFDEGRTNEEGIPVLAKSSQIRFPYNKGIAGYVSKTGKTVNIVNAYSDPRFNPDVDKQTGYKTHNILCMPIANVDGVIGVVQMVNKLNGECFTQEDMNTFETFAVYCALALHYCRIYNMLVHQQTKYKVAMEVLEFHIRCDEEHAKALTESPYILEEKIPNDFDSFRFVCYDYNSSLPQLFIKMVTDTFGEKTFQMDKLCRFILTIRKNYRPVTYHNWEHGFHVAHSLWQMIRHNGELFTDLEKISLIVAGICHDVDHRGYNNDYFKKMNLPLATLYSTSVMESHHYKQTITILHSEGHEIFSFLTAEQHKAVLNMIRKNIIATDLALYFQNQKDITKLLESNTFDDRNPDHKEKLMMLMMTAADLCAVAKPWESQARTVEYLCEEFYKQGDEEKKKGIQPLPIMDRDNKHEIPQQQIGFLSFICKPVYSTLVKIMPNTAPLLDMCLETEKQWKNLIAERKAKDGAAEK